jgi:hypothetical protein
MENKTGVLYPLHSLIPLEDFKAILGLDDREGPLSRYCLTAATFTIAQYCNRCFFKKKHFEHIVCNGDLILPLREYPVREMVAVYALGGFSDTGELLEPELYRVIPDFEESEGLPEDTVYNLSLSPALNRAGGFPLLRPFTGRVMPVGRLPLTWPPPVWNWLPGT